MLNLFLTYPLSAIIEILKAGQQCCRQNILKKKHRNSMPLFKPQGAAHASGKTCRVKTLIAEVPVYAPYTQRF